MPHKYEGRFAGAAKRKKIRTAAWAKEHREYLLEYRKRYRVAHPEIARRASRAWRARNKEKVELDRKARQRRLKVQCFNSYGGCVCVCCHERELSFLSIDHVAGNGNAHRRTIKNSGGTHFYSWLRRNDFPVGYRVLCMNCQFGRKNNSGICPHQQELGTEIATVSGGGTK